MYFLGVHPSGSYVFTPSAAPSWHEVDLMAPHIYVNFASINTRPQLVPDDRCRPMSLIHATLGITPSIYVLDNDPSEDDHCYLVSSESLDTPERKQMIFEPSNSSGPASPIYLRDSELLDSYAVPRDQVLASLRFIFENADRAISLSPAHRTDGLGYKIDPSKYIVTRQQVITEFEALISGASFWSQLKGTDGGEDKDDLSVGDEEEDEDDI